MDKLYKTVIILTFWLLLGAVSFAQKPEAATPTIANFTADMRSMDGYFPFYWDDATGKIWLEINRWDEEFIYVNALSAGIGSNDIGLDRGQLGDTRIVKFQRVGPKVLLVQPNYDYRAVSDNPAERNAVDEAFARSVLWGFHVKAREGDRMLVDATPFLLHDAHGIAASLRRQGQGTYKVAADRSAIYLPRTKNFPLNTEFDATVTYVGEARSWQIRSVTPTPDAISVRLHHSFVALPEPGYTPRQFDPRAGYGQVSFADYATPIAEPVRKRWIPRHRLRKKDPQAARSEAVEPIIYYVDDGAPEPIRTALIEGARWWNQAFEAIGYVNAYQVRVLPADADPLDVRYNVIQWVHRSTRGWSYGSSVRDPRTGEIIKGHVTLGSLRVRQDFLIAEGLLQPYADGTTVPPEMQEMALARLRQLSAHEVGHTLGISHNFAASVFERASVMDYPHPLYRLGSNGRIDLSDAYGAAIGAWDKVTIAYGYQDYPAGTDVAAELQKTLRDAAAAGLQFISDRDARPAGGLHPLAHLWDNGADAAEELERMMKIRKQLLARFSQNAVRNGAPLSTLENVLVPVYMLHRYQIEAAAKLLGGMSYTYSVRGDGSPPPALVPASRQRRALTQLLETLRPDHLALPNSILELIPPPAHGFGRDRENFDGKTGPALDPISAAETAADLTLRMLLNPERAARLIVDHSRDKDIPGFGDVLEKLITTTWQGKWESDYHTQVGIAVGNASLNHLLTLAANERASTQVRAHAYTAVLRIQALATTQLENTRSSERRAQFAWAAAQVDAFRSAPESFRPAHAPTPPAGSPIGSAADRAQCSWH